MENDALQNAALAHTLADQIEQSDGDHSLVRETLDGLLGCDDTCHKQQNDGGEQYQAGSQLLSHECNKHQDKDYGYVDDRETHNSGV